MYLHFTKNIICYKHRKDLNNESKRNIRIIIPDECLASIEIGRRGFKFAKQYIFNRRLHKKITIFPELELVKSQIVLSLEELDIDVPNFDSWIDILSAVKKSKVKYRFFTSEA